MTKTLEQLLEFIGAKADPKRICGSCRDNSFCGNCVFYREAQAAKVA
jgi:hypothetical protein